MSGLALVTGASGFLGRLLVRRLADEGRPVRVLERRPSDAFDGLTVERARGDVTDPSSLVGAVRDVDLVFNLAGVVSYEDADVDRLHDVNAAGVEHVLAAARQAGVRRVVHVSSVAAVGMALDPAQPPDEDAPFPDRAWRNPYARTKRLGEEAALRAAADGQDVVVVNPGLTIGAGDVNRISTFSIEQYLRGTLRTTMRGGLHYVDARDVVDGILLAERAGRSGRRYILGTPDGNLPHDAFFRLVGEISGRRRRTVALPAPVVVGAGVALARLRVPLPLRPGELRNGRYHWYATTARAIEELGYRPRPVAEAIESTVRWFRERGVRGR